MCSWSRNSRGHYYRSYRCELKNRAANRCTCKAINADELEGFVIDMLKNLDVNSLDVKGSTSSNSNLKQELNILNKTLSENNKLLQGLIKKLALIDDIDILSMIQSEIKKIKSENENIDKRINEINLSMFDIEDDLKKKKIFLESFETIDFVDDVETKRRLISTLVEYFIYDSNTGTVEYKLRL